MWEDDSLWAGARQGKLLLRACRCCGEICHPPLPVCPHCQSADWEQRAACGKAQLVSWLVSIHPGTPASEPRIVIVARLAEGVNFVSNLIGVPSDNLQESMPLELCFATMEGTILPLFRPAGVPV